jgi:hypothetical protein
MAFLMIEFLSDFRGQYEKGDDEKEKEMNSRSSFYFRRIVVCDGFVNVQDSYLRRNCCDFRVWIPCNVELLCSNGFTWPESRSFIVFESNSRLIRIESKAFYGSSLQSILIPSNVEILGSECFSSYESLSSITFE